MPDSPIHEILNDIRKKYTGMTVSMLDIRNIEDLYRICSIYNVRNDNCAFLRITSFGYKEVLFEDIVLNIDTIKPFVNEEDLIFKSKKILYENVYGVILDDSKTSLLSEYFKPSFDFTTMEDTIINLQKKCTDLEIKIREKQSILQPNLFDFDDQTK